MGSTQQSVINPLVDEITGSKIGFYFQMAKDLKAKGQTVYDLTAGEPDYDTPDVIKQAGIEAINNNITHYPNQQGEPRLRQAIAKKFKVENDLEYSPDDILVSAGAKQSMFQSVLALTHPGDEILMQSPYWTSYPQFVQFAQAKLVVIETTFKNDFKLTALQLEEKITPKSKVLMLNFPSNPTGVIYNREELEELAAVLRKHPQVWVISDEIYEGLTYPPNKHVSFASLEGMKERTITVNGFSKTFAMTGWRLGYAAGPNFVIKAMLRLQAMITSGACSISQQAGIAALEKLEPFGGKEVQTMVQGYEERRNFVRSQLKEIKGVAYGEAQGGFFYFLDVSNFFGENVFVEGYGPVKTSEDVILYIIQKAKVFMVPGEAFGVPQGLRLSYACNMKTLEKAFE